MSHLLKLLTNFLEESQPVLFSSDGRVYRLLWLLLHRFTAHTHSKDVCMSNQRLLDFIKLLF